MRKSGKSGRRGVGGTGSREDGKTGSPGDGKSGDGKSRRQEIEKMISANGLKSHVSPVSLKYNAIASTILIDNLSSSQDNNSVIVSSGLYYFATFRLPDFRSSRLPDFRSFRLPNFNAPPFLSVIFQTSF